MPQKTLERLLGVSIANLAASAAVGSPPKQAVDGQTKLASPGSSATTQAPPSTNRLALAAMKFVQTANSARGDDEASSSRPPKQPSAPKEPVAMATSTRELRSSAASNVTSTRVRSQRESKDAAVASSSSNRRKPGKRIVTSTATGPQAKKFAATPSSSVATTTMSTTTTTATTTTTNLLSQSRALLASINRTGATTGTTAKTTMPTSSQKTSPPKQMVFPPKTASPSTTTTMTLKPVGVRQSGSAGTMPILMSSGGLQRSIYIVSTSMSQSGTAILVPKATKTTSPAVAFTTSKSSVSTTTTRSSAPVTKQTVVSLKTTAEEPTPVRPSLGGTDAVVSASSDESLAAQQLISLQSLSKDPSILEASATLLSLQMAPVPPKVTEKAKVEEKREEEKMNEETKEGGSEVGEEEEEKNEEDAEDSNKATDDAKEEQSGEKEKETKDDKCEKDEDTETEEEVNVTEVDGGDEKKNASPRAESPLLPPPSKSPPATTALIAPKAIYPETRRSKTPSTPPPPLRIQSKSLTPTSSATFQPLYPAPSPTTKSSSSSTSVEFPQTPPPLLKRTRTPPISQAQSPPIISPSAAHRSSSGQGFRVRIQGNTVSRALEATASSCPPSLANSRVASPSTAAAAAARGRSLTPVNELASGKFSAVDSFLESFRLEESSSAAGAPKGNSTRGEGDGGSGGSGGGETDPLSSIIAELADSFPDTDTFLGQNMPASSQLDFDADLLSDVLASIESETGQSSSTIAPNQQQQSATIQPEPLKKRKSPLPPPLSQPQVSATQSHSHQARSGKKGKGSAAAGSYQTRGLSSRRVSVASGDSGQLSDSESGDGLRHSKRKRKLTAIMTDDPYPPPKSETLNVPFWVKTALRCFLWERKRIFYLISWLFFQLDA